MKIIQVIDRLNAGGAERIMVDLSNLLHEDGQDVSVMFLLYPGPLGNQLHPDIPQFILNRKNKFSIIKLLECGDYLKQFDIIHCHHQYIFNYVKLASILTGSKTPIILHDHGPNNTLKKLPFPLSIIFKPKWYIGVSSQLKQWAISKIGLSQDHSYLLPNTIRVRNPNTESQKYDLLLVSNIRPDKNQLFAVRLARETKMSLLIIGNIQDQQYFQQISQAAKGLPVEFVTNSTDASIYLNQARIGLHTSQSETGPLVLLEYMACGLPFLAYETGHVAQQSKLNFPSYFIHNHNIIDWGKRIQHIRSTHTQNKSNELKSYFVNNFGENTYLQKCLNIYQQICRDYLL